MTLNISVRDVVNWGAQRALTLARPDLRPQDRAPVLPIARYNTMLHGLHAGVALLVTAAVMAIFTKFSAALVLGAVGHALYSAMTREIDQATAPDNAANVLNRVELPEGWVADRVIIFDKPVVKNYLPYTPLEGARPGIAQVIVRMFNDN